MLDKILGEYCARCGKTRTKSEFDGIPTCGTCELDIRAEREEKRNCPECQTEMDKQVVMNIIVDKCPACHGAWLDGGELDLVSAGMAQGGSDFAAGMVMGMCMG